MVSIRIDITSLKEREWELAEKTGLLEATLASMAQGVIMTDADLHVRAINDQAISLLGLTSEVSQIGAHVGGIFRFQAVRGDFGAVDVEAEVAERLSTFRQSFTKIVERTKGSAGWVEKRAEAEQQRLEEELRHAQKMEALEVLSPALCPLMPQKRAFLASAD